jgi:D-alanine-D-alanine ligase
VLAALNAAIEEALEFDSKVVIEKAILGREIECGVLQVSGVTQVSDPGEVKISAEHEFYDFTAKYLDGATEFITQIDLPDQIKKTITSAAKRAFEALGCEGLARVDFFLDGNGEVIINEINTMPGFTSTSVFPKLWREAGIGYSELITILIESAMSRSMSVTR